MAFDYSSRDYSTIKSDLLARASRIAPEWTDRDPADFGMVLVDLWAQMGDVLHFYVDRTAGEAFLTTATQRESVLSFANLFDYDPGSRTSSTATVTLRNSSDTDIELPQYTRFVARYDNVAYQAYTTSDASLSAGTNTIVSLAEGTVVSSPAETLTSASSGTDAQRYRLSNLGVVKDSVVVTVYEDGVTPTEYRRVIRLSEARVGERVFVLNTNSGGYIEVSFGTAGRGFVPPANSVITAVYAYSNGSVGNLPANSVISFRDSTPSGVSIVSSSSFSGGSDEETIASLRNTIPSVISAQNRAVTLSDYTNYALSIDGIAKAAVQYQPSAGSGNASITVYPQIDRSSDYLTTSDTEETVSDIVKYTVVNTLQPKSMLGVEVYCADTVTWREITVNATVNVLAGYVNIYVKRDVEAAIDAIFDFDNVYFGQTISLGQIYRAIMSVSGVDYAAVTVMDDEGGSGLETTITVGDYVLPKKGTVNITANGGITST